MESYRTLRGAIAGHESEESNYFHFSISLRIFGENIPFEEISKTLGVEPTNIHRKGERRGPNSPIYKDDTWQYQPNIPETESLDKHIEALWKIVKPQLPYLLELKKLHHVDVFCGYRSNCDHAGIQVSHECLELFTALKVPFGVSIVVG